MSFRSVTITPFRIRFDVQESGYLRLTLDTGHSNIEHLRTKLLNMSDVGMSHLQRDMQMTGLSPTPSYVHNPVLM